jgi:hypothetical protein
VHGLRALLHAATSPAPGARDGQVRREVNEALRQDPLELEALRLQRLHLHEHREDLGTAQRLVQRHPREARAWLVLADALEYAHRPTDALAALTQARWLGAGEGPAVVSPMRRREPEGR